MLRIPYLRITPAIASVSLYMTCSLAKVFKRSTNVRLKSVKNSPSPKPTTSLTIFLNTFLHFDTPNHIVV